MLSHDERYATNTANNVYYEYSNLNLVHNIYSSSLLIVPV